MMIGFKIDLALNNIKRLIHHGADNIFHSTKKYFHYIIYLYIRYTGCSWPSQREKQNALTAPLQRGKTLHNKCPGYDTKQFDVAVPVKLELCGMQSSPLLPSLPRLL